MASVFRRNGRWFLRFKDATGAWTKRTSDFEKKADALRMATDLERQAERVRLGLEPLPTTGPAMTFEQLYDWWWGEYGSKRRGLKNDSIDAFNRKRLLPILGSLAVREVTPAKIEEMLQSHVQELSPASLNHLRSAVRIVFGKALKRDLAFGKNPAMEVDKRKVPKRVYETLRAEEVPLLIAALEDKWRDLFLCAVWTGMRKGELLGLCKADVDLVVGTITIRHSHAADTTKGSHEDVIPIARPLRPHLERAIRQSPSELVFPREDGSPYPPDVPLEEILRRALGRAGLVTGYQHVCRRKECGFAELRQDNQALPCPRCSFRLWPKALPRPVRFHDLRGTTGTLLARAGAPLAVAQRILRHADPRLTLAIYTRVDMDDLRAGLSRIFIPDMSPDLVPEFLVPALSPGPHLGKTKALIPASNLAGDQGLRMVGATGFEPATTCTPSRCATRLRYAPRKLSRQRLG